MTGKELSALRRKWGMTKAGLARIIDCDMDSVSRWENGAYPVPIVVGRALQCWEKNGLPKELREVARDRRKK